MKNQSKKTAQENPFSILSFSLIDRSSFNPRKTVSDAGLRELAESIREKGVIQPIVVRPVNGRYEIVCGERRYRAAVMAGLESIPVCIRNLGDNDAEEYAITENLQRVDVSPLEEAAAFARLMDTKGYSIADLVAKFGKSDVFVRSRIKLVQLNQQFQDLLAKDIIKLGIANVLSNCSAELQERIYNEHFADEVYFYNRWSEKKPSELNKLIEKQYSTKLDDYFFNKEQCFTCGSNTANFVLFCDKSADGKCMNKECLYKKNDDYVLEQAKTLLAENPSLSFCKHPTWATNSNVLTELQTEGQEVFTINVMRDFLQAPDMPVRDEYENDEEYDEAIQDYNAEFSKYEDEKQVFEEQKLNGELLPFIWIQKNNARIAYVKANKANETNVTSSHAEKSNDHARLLKKIDRNKVLCLEKIRDQYRETLKKVEIIDSSISSLEDCLLYYFMAKGINRELMDSLKLDKCPMEYKDMFGLSQEQKAIILRGYLVKQLENEYVSSTKVTEDNPVRAFLYQHMPDEVIRIDTEQKAIYAKRNDRLQERIALLSKDSIAGETEEKE